MEKTDRVEADLEAYWTQKQQKINGNPEVLKSAKFWQGQLQLLDMLLKHYKKAGDLNSFEKSSLATMEAERRLALKYSDPYRISQVAGGAGRITGKAAAGILHYSGDFLYRKFDRGLVKTAQYTPMLISALLHLARIPVALGGLALLGGSQVLKWTVDRLLPSHKPDIQQMKAAAAQQKRQKASQGVEKPAGKEKNAGQQPQQIPGPVNEQSQSPARPGDPAQQPGGPVQGPHLRADGSGGTINQSSSNHRERIVTPPNPTLRLGR